MHVYYGLSVWPVQLIGVAGSILGRYLLTLYFPALSSKYFKPAKNEDVQFLGEQLKAKGWKSQLFIVGYSLVPLPATPLFLARAMARIVPRYRIPSFFVGKLTRDSAAVATGRYASQNLSSPRAKPGGLAVMYCSLWTGTPSGPSCTKMPWPPWAPTGWWTTPSST
ncbi:hypothetical protein GCM10022409_47110 [Hymenobacter glaciei]|uniref:Uncharacterized protein n=1 Tax=Hymenobacter glaciei TaxID=877209 RepID=A0ABP7UWX8_9BACT